MREEELHQEHIDNKNQTTDQKAVKGRLKEFKQEKNLVLMQRFNHN